MSPETPSKTTQLCPTCGTRLAEDAERCLVCGTELRSTASSSTKSERGVQGSRMPTLTLSLPAILGLFALFLAIGAGLVYFALQQTDQIIDPTPTATITLTLTATTTSTPTTPTATNTPAPSPTPLAYRVAQGDNCSTIAFAFGVSINSIVLLNDLPATCDTLFVGQELLIPQPTPTPTPPPTATLSPADATEAACPKVDYTVQENDTLSSISANYAVPIAVLKTYNGLVNDIVQSGQNLVIPLCEREIIGGPTPTPTLPPPYAAPNLLLPADGSAFTLADEAIVLQWASVGSLRSNEAYAVTIIDVTSGQNERLVEYIPDTKFLIPISLRPSDNIPHVFRWWVLTTRQVGTDDDGNPIWEPAGVASNPRVFTWTGTGRAPESTPTPSE